MNEPDMFENILLFISAFLCGYLAHVVVSQNAIEIVIPEIKITRKGQKNVTSSILSAIKYERGGGSAISAPSLTIDSDTSLSELPSLDNESTAETLLAQIKSSDQSEAGTFEVKTAVSASPREIMSWTHLPIHNELRTLERSASKKYSPKVRYLERGDASSRRFIHL